MFTHNFKTFLIFSLFLNVFCICASDNGVFLFKEEKNTIEKTFRAYDYRSWFGGNNIREKFEAYVCPFNKSSFRKQLSEENGDEYACAREKAMRILETNEKIDEIIQKSSSAYKIGFTFFSIGLLGLYGSYTARDKNLAFCSTWLLGYGLRNYLKSYYYDYNAKHLMCSSLPDMANILPSEENPSEDNVVNYNSKDDELFGILKTTNIQWEKARNYYWQETLRYNFYQSCLSYSFNSKAFMASTLGYLWYKRQ